MKFDIITIFPEIIQSYLSVGVLGRAIHLKNVLSVDIWNPRDFTKNKHLKVDDTPYSGGAGMILQIEPIYNTLEEIIKLNPKVCLYPNIQITNINSIIFCLYDILLSL